MTPELRARLGVYRIELLSEAKEFSILGRESCFALVNRAEAGETGIGSSGMMTENGPAYLVWRDGQAYLVGKGSETAADSAQVAAIRSFSDDLKKALEAPLGQPPPKPCASEAKS